MIDRDPVARVVDFRELGHRPLERATQDLQLMAGTNPKIVSEVLGHTEIAITLDRYSHALPTMQTEAMARLDAVLGRSPLDRAESSSARKSAPELWLDQDAPADHEGTSDRDKGADKGARGPRRPKKKPDPSVDRAENWRFWYRIPDSNR